MQGKRVDTYLVEGGIGLSRSQVIKLIKNKNVWVNKSPVTKQSYKLKENDEVVAIFEIEEKPKIEPEDIPLNIVYEDEDVIVVNKPKGMVVHPARGHPQGTLVNAILWHCKNLPESPDNKLRPGVVHRLDKDTTGLIMFAKNTESLTSLGKQIAEKKVKKKYLAFVWGKLELPKGEIYAPVGRDTIDRKKMAVTPVASREAITEFEVLDIYCNFVTYLQLSLLTGRTHQIRVHLSHYGHPVVGDPDYEGTSPTIPKNQKEATIFTEILKLIDRQALHSSYLGFFHPRTKKWIELTAPLPEDMQRIREFLEEKCKTS